MKITFKVTTTGSEPTEVTTSYGDLIALENKYGVDASDLGNRQRAQWLAFMAWNALKRRGDVKVGFEEWVETIEALEPVDSEGNA